MNIKNKANHLNLIIAKNYDEMSEVASQIILGQMYKNRRVNLAITAGKTPIETYNKLIPLVKGKSYFSNVNYYNFDEIPYKIKKTDPITISALNRSYFIPAEISTDQIQKLNQYNYTTWDEKIKADGGIDLIFLGIGEDGHYCGNLPNTTKFSDYTSKVDCDDNMKSILSNLFEDHKDIPDFYVTMGPRSVMNCKNILLCANGKHKANIIKRLLSENVSELLPASILTMHPNLTILIDEDAASSL